MVRTLPSWMMSELVIVGEGSSHRHGIGLLSSLMCVSLLFGLTHATRRSSSYQAYSLEADAEGSQG